MEKIKLFFNGVKKEAERVRWPNKKNMTKHSMAVLSFCVFFCAFFYLINLVVVALKEVLS